MTEKQKIKYWWSEDLKWFCILLDDGVSRATVSLTPREAGELAVEAMTAPADTQSRIALGYTPVRIDD